MLQIKNGMFILNYLGIPVTNLIKNHKQTMWKTHLIHFPFHNVQIRSAAVRSVRSIFIVQMRANPWGAPKRERWHICFHPKVTRVPSEKLFGAKAPAAATKKNSQHTRVVVKRRLAQRAKSRLLFHLTPHRKILPHAYTRWKKSRPHVSYLLHTHTHKHAKIMIVRLIKLGAQLHARGWNYAASAWEPASVIPTE